MVFTKELRKKTCPRETLSKQTYSKIKQFSRLSLTKSFLAKSSKNTNMKDSNAVIWEIKWRVPNTNSWNHKQLSRLRTSTRRLMRLIREFREESTCLRNSLKGWWISLLYRLLRSGTGRRLSWNSFLKTRETPCVRSTSMSRKTVRRIYPLWGLILRFLTDLRRKPTTSNTTTRSNLYLSTRTSCRNLWVSVRNIKRKA